MRQAGNRLRLIDYGCENGFVSKRTFPGKTPRPAHSRETLPAILRATRLKIWGTEKCSTTDSLPKNMTILKIIRLLIFWLAISFIVSSIFALTVGQYLPIEFSNYKVSSDYYYIVFTFLPIAILLTLTGTIKKKNKKAKNWTIGGLTGLGAIICFFYLVSIMFTVGFGAWTDEAILYRNASNKNITINQQIFDNGALGYGGHRTVKLTPFLEYFQTVKQIDTINIDNTKWIYVNEKGNLKFP